MFRPDMVPMVRPHREATVLPHMVAMVRPHRVATVLPHMVPMVRSHRFAMVRPKWVAMVHPQLIHVQQVATVHPNRVVLNVPYS